jgi:hypothetical protein
MADLNQTITFPDKVIATVATPAAGEHVLFVDSVSGYPATKDSSAVVTLLNGTPPANSVTNAMLVNVTAPVIHGRTTAGTGSVENLTPTQTTAMLDEATTSLKGLMSTTDKKRMGQFYDAVADFGFVGDLATVFDGAMTSGLATLTCATSAPFVAGDVGKRITVAGAGAAGVQLTTTILSFTSTSIVTLNANAGTTVSNKGTSFGTDNAAATTLMVSTVNNAVYPGTHIFFGQSATNAYGFTSRVVFNKAAVIEGISNSWTTDSGDYTKAGGTRLAWWGTDSDGATGFGGFFEFNPTGVQSLKGVSVRNLTIDCRNGDQNEALYGLKLYSCHGFNLHNLFIIDALACGIWTDIGTTPTEAKDTTRFSINQFCSRQLDNPAVAMTTPILMTSAVVLTTTPQNLTVAANTLPTSGYLWTATTVGAPTLVRYTGGGGSVTLTGCVVALEDVVLTPTTVNGGNVVQAVPGNGECIELGGGTAANTCCGSMTMLQLSHGTTWGPAAIEYANSDSVIANQMMINGGIATNDGAINRIRKPGVRLNGSIVSATLASRNNVFNDGDAGAGGVSVMGVNNAGARLLAMSQPHYWLRYQLGNGAPVPVVEGGAYFDWTTNGGMDASVTSAAAIADQAIAAATATLITGSLIAVPPQGFQIGTALKWTICGSAAAVGVAANVFNVKVGTAGTTADANIQTFTSTIGTAAASEWRATIEVTIRTLGAAATNVGECTIINSAAAAGFINLATNVLAGTAATFNSTTAQQFINVTLTTGAAKTATIKQCFAEVIHPANP